MTHTRSARRDDPSDSGASAVEFALVVPVLLLFIYGIIAFGFVFSQQISMNSAVRDASRAGVVKSVDGVSLTCSTVATQVRNSMVGNTIGIGAGNVNTIVVTVTGPAGACVLPSGSSSATGSGTANLCDGSTSNSAVTVNASFQSRTPVPLPVISNINLESDGIFQCEYR